MPRIFKHLEADYLQVNIMSTSAQINQLKYTILYYTIYFIFYILSLGANVSDRPLVIERQVCSLSTEQLIKTIMHYTIRVCLINLFAVLLILPKWLR